MQPNQEQWQVILQFLSYRLLTFQISLWRPKHSPKIYEIVFPVPADHFNSNLQKAPKQVKDHEQKPPYLNSKESIAYSAANF